jgi:hypothetical protein
MIKFVAAAAAICIFANTATAEIPDGRYVCSLDSIWVGDAGRIRGDDKYVTNLFSIDVDASAGTIKAQQFQFPLSNPLPADFKITRKVNTRYEGVSDEGALILFKGFSYVISNIYSERTGPNDAQGISVYLGQCNHVTEDNTKIYEENHPESDAL